MKFLKAILPTLAAVIFAAGISQATFYKWSQTANTNATADATINWAEGMAPSAVNDSARAMMAATAKYRDDVSGKLLTTGTSTAYVLATNQVFSALALMDGAELAFRMSVTSGVAPTLNVDALGAKALNQATSVAIPTGALVSGAIYRATYVNATNEWIVQGIAGSIPSGTTMMSMSTSCPTGWTIQTATTADRGFRLSTTAGGGTGGSVPWASLFGANGGGLALAMGHLPTWTLGASISDPTHTHANTLGDPGHFHTITPTAAVVAANANLTGTSAVGAATGAGSTTLNLTGMTITNAAAGTGITASITGTGAAGGSGVAHTHVTPALAYVDLIGCAKN